MLIERVSNNGLIIFDKETSEIFTEISIASERLREDGLRLSLDPKITRTISIYIDLAKADGYKETTTKTAQHKSLSFLNGLYRRPAL